MVCTRKANPVEIFQMLLSLWAEMSIFLQVQLHAEVATAPDMGLVSKAPVFELFRVNQFTVIETG